LRRRKWTEPTAAPLPDLGAEGRNAGAAIPLQLEGIVVGRRNQLVELLLSFVQRFDSSSPVGRILGSFAAPHSGAAACHLGWTADSSECVGQIVCSRSERTPSAGISSGLRARIESLRVHLRSFKAPPVAELVPQKSLGVEPSCSVLFAPNAATAHSHSSILETIDPL